MFHVKHTGKILEKLAKLAQISFKKGEIPVGALVIYNNEIIGLGYNTRQKKYDVCGHAEINAIRQAEKKLKDWRLNDCKLYSTLEPCEMCYKIIKECRIKKVYYLISNNKKHNYPECEQIYFPGNKTVQNI